MPTGAATETQNISWLNSLRKAEPILISGLSQANECGDPVADRAGNTPHCTLYRTGGALTSAWLASPVDVPARLARAGRAGNTQVARGTVPTEPERRHTRGRTGTAGRAGRAGKLLRQ
jgi:hypothetical protein